MREYSDLTHAGTYNLKADNGTTISFAIDKGGKVTECKAGALVVCTGSATLNTTGNAADFQITGNDGQNPIDTTASLKGSISSSGTVSGSYSGNSASDGPFSGTFTGAKAANAATGSAETGNTSAAPSALGRVVAIDPVATASANGAVSYRITNQTPSKAGSFTPSPDGFETEFDQNSKIYRWIDKVNNMRLEAKQSGLNSEWQATLYDDTRSELGYYPFGFGEGFGYSLASFNVDQVVVTTQRGTVADKSISITFAPKSSSPNAQFLSGTLTGSASHYLWSQAELPRSSRGILTWDGKSRDVISTTVQNVTGSTIPSIAAVLADGSSFTAYPSFSTPSQIVQTRQPGMVVEFRCGPILGGTCDYAFEKTGSHNALFKFSTVVYKGTSRTASPSTRFEGNVSVAQQYSTLTVNGSPFELTSGNFGTAVVSPVSSVGDTTRFSFQPSNSGVAGAINIWRRGDKVVQIQIPSANGSQFICTEKLSDSRTNTHTRFDPPFTIPACPPITALLQLGDLTVRGFEFSDFKLNAAPSNFVVPTPTVVLNGILMAKGL